MDFTEINRLSRLIAILTQLQTKRIITSTILSEKFGVSVRTIYRDLRALEHAGVPILVEEGKGYSLMDGYKFPPVMLTESQTNALILAEQLVLKNKDTSFIADYSGALDKIKAILRQTEKDNANLLANRTRFEQNLNRERSSNNLSQFQIAITNFHLVKIFYTNEKSETSIRIVEPFALLSTNENWLMIALCRLRSEFRYFRLDRVSSLQIQNEKFSPHKMTLQEFFNIYH